MAEYEKKVRDELTRNGCYFVLRYFVLKKIKKGGNP